MSNNSNIPSFTITHISSYVNGTMSHEDMYAFEKAMQADPFLEDAVEGFREANIKKAETDVAAIKAALLPEKETAKIVPFYIAYKTWFSAAAAIIVIGAITFAILKPSNNNQQIAIVTPGTEKPKAFIDTTHTINNSPIVANQKVTPTVASSTKQPVIVADKEVVVALVRQETVRALNDDIKYDSNIVCGDNLELNANEFNKQVLQGRIEGLRVEKKEKINIDLSKRTIAANGYSNTNNTQNFFAAPAKDSTQTAKNSLDEVIVVGYGSAKRKDVTASVAKVAIDPLDSLMPVGGWQYYSKYMNQKIGFIGDTTSNNHLVITDRTGQKLDDIDIEFSVDKEGNAYNVKVITDVDTTQAKTITNAVVEGPKWISRKKKNKVKIPLKTP